MLDFIGQKSMLHFLHDQKERRPNPRNLPDGANYRLAADRPEDVSADGQGWPLTAAS